MPYLFRSHPFCYIFLSFLTCVMPGNENVIANNAHRHWLLIKAMTNHIVTMPAKLTPLSFIVQLNI